MEYVYFVASGLDSKLVKIGKSKTPQKRLHSMQTSNPNLSILALVISDDVINEGNLHAYFSRERERNEWFNFTDEIKELVMALSNPEKHRACADDLRARIKKSGLVRKITFSLQPTKTIQVNVRLTPGDADLIREIAKRLRADKEFRGMLIACLCRQVRPDSRDQEQYVTDLENRIAKLESQRNCTSVGGLNS